MKIITENDEQFRSDSENVIVVEESEEEVPKKRAKLSSLSDEINISKSEADSNDIDGLSSLSSDRSDPEDSSDQEENQSHVSWTPP